MKSQVADAIKNFVIFAQNQKGKIVRAINSDNGREYVNNYLLNFFAKIGIGRQVVTVPYNSQSRGSLSYSRCKAHYKIVTRSQGNSTLVI